MHVDELSVCEARAKFLRFAAAAKSQCIYYAHKKADDEASAFLDCFGVLLLFDPLSILLDPNLFREKVRHIIRIGSETVSYLGGGCG